MIKKINSIYIVGMGALGLLYGSTILDKNPEIKLKFLMDENRFQKYGDQEVICNGTARTFPAVSSKHVHPVDLILIAVKYNDLADAAELIRPCVGSDTIIMSVLNGISSEEYLGSLYGMEHMIFTVAQGMDAMKFGNQFHYSNMGKLHIGIVTPAQQQNLNSVSTFFDEFQIPYYIEADIRYRIWSKFMLNVGVNQTCMVYGTTYSGVLQKGEANTMMISAMREVIAVGNAEGIALSEKDINQYIEILRTLAPDNLPSMAQDRINQKPSEVEMFAGTVIQLALKHQIYVPVNEYFYDKVQEIESSYKG